MRSTHARAFAPGIFLCASRNYWTIRRGGAGHALHRACLCAALIGEYGLRVIITRFPRICKQPIIGQSKVAASSMELSVPIIQTKIKGKSNDNVNHH